MSFRRKGTVLLAAIAAASLFACSGKNEAAPAEEESSSLVRTLKTSQGDMRYIRFGNPEGDPFVILPGVSLRSVMNSAEAIKDAYDLFAEDYDVYVFDRLSVFPEGYDVNAMAASALEAIDQLSLSDVTLMGVSQGGMMAMIMASSAPEKIEALVLCSTAASLKYADPAVFEEWTRLAEEKNGTGLMESFGRYVYTPDFFNTYKDVIIAQGNDVSDLEFKNFLISMKGMEGFDITDRLSRISCPVFVLGAGEDKVLGAQASVDLMNTLGCEGYIYEGKGHGVFDEAPDYRPRIKEFLDRIQ